MSVLSRRDFLGAAGAGALASAQTARKLNFVFLLIDDLGWTDLACFGSTFYETPNLDRLASQGMKFTNGYAACPVCSPSRAAILTGKYPARLHLTDWIPGRRQWPTAKLLTPSFNQQLPLDEVTTAEALKPAGYPSASVGKWHLGDVPYYPEKQGFDLNVAGTRRGSPTSYFGPFDLPNLQGGTKEDYLTDRLTTEALKFIEDNKDRPFFLYHPHFAVHIPLQAKKEMIAKYEPKARGRKLQNNPIYAAMIESMDEAVGRVMRKLDELGIADNTVVFFTGDNGGLMYEGRRPDPVTSNRPLRAGKGHLYEGGIRVPLIIRWPGVVKAGSVCHEPACGVDYFPTILEMAGLKTDPKWNVDGKSIVPLLRGQQDFRRDALYWHYPHYSNQGGQPGAALREGNLKLIEFYEDSHLELYDLAEDTGERNNLAQKMPQKAAELQRKLRAWRTSVKAAMPTVNPAYDAAKANQGLTGADPKNQ
jgi:arylsulfatase A